MYRHDNLQAFDGAPIEVEFDTEGKEVSRALFVINDGAIVKEYQNPTSPINVELDETDTGKLQHDNVGKLILFDSQGRKMTCDGELRFVAEKAVYIES
jgi:hypothetical protein